jgi:hypothetical protein
LTFESNIYEIDSSQNFTFFSLPRASEIDSQKYICTARKERKRVREREREKGRKGERERERKGERV